MARRKAAIEQARAQGPVLVVDSGNALYRDTSPPDSAAQQRAELIARAMVEIGTAGMPVGARDLSGGLDALRKLVARTHLPALSCNLIGADGKALFPTSTIARAGGARVGLVGVSPSPLPPSVQGVKTVPAIPATQEAVRRLRDQKVDLVIVLAAIPRDEAGKLAEALGPLADFVIQSSEGGGLGARRENGNALITSGERGRQFGRLALNLAGGGPFFDRSEADQARRASDFLAGQIADAKQRMEHASPADRKALSDAIAGFESRRAELAKTLAALSNRPGRSYALDSVMLGPDFPDDPALKSEVDRLSR